jgi:zinc protease
VKSIVAGLCAGFIFFTSLILPATAADAKPDVDTVLDNGLHVIVVVNRLAPVVTTSIAYNVGSNDDTMPGIAHATEHMLFRGTTDVSSNQFANIATRTGAQYNADTQNMMTRFYFTAPSSYLDVILHLEADRMTNAKIAQSDWAIERGAIEQEVKAKMSNPVMPLALRANHIFYGDSPWGADPVGTIASFDKMKATDIASFYHTWYHPNNATLVIAGDIDPIQALASVEALFGELPRATVPSHPPLVVAPFPMTTIKETIDFPLPISMLLVSTPGLSNADYPATEVLFSILNSKRGGLADLVLGGKAIYAFAFEGGFPAAGSGVLASLMRPGNDPTNGLSDIQSVLAAYAKSGVPPDLFAAAKGRLLTASAYDAASIPGQALSWSQSLAVIQKTPSSLYDDVANVTIDDVNRVLRKYVASAPGIALASSAKPGASIPTQDAGAGKENVTVTAKDSVALPAWTQKYFAAPLRAPAINESSRIFHLKNGVTIAYRRESFSPTVVIDGHILNNTDLYEPRGKDGVASIASALIGYGTTLHDYKAYQAELDAIAAGIDLGTDFSAEAQAQNFDQTVATLAEGELNPAFPADQFAVISKNTVQSLHAFEGQPQEKAQIARLYALYPPGDLHRRHATSQTVAAVTLDDVKRWYAFTYRPDETTISVVGDVPFDQVKASFEKYFGSWKAKGLRPSFIYPRVKTKSSVGSTTVSSTTSKQADVTLTQRITLRRGDKDIVALELANTMLSGEGTGSMLFTDVRKAKGYVYSIDSDLSVTSGGSTFELTFASDPKNVNAAQRAASQTLQRLRSFPPNASDLALAKAKLLSTFIVSVDSYDGVARELLLATEDGMDANSLSKYYARVLSTTPAEVQSAMQRWIDPAKFARVIVAPQQ